MKTIRRLIYGEVLAAIALVALGFLALFFFFDLVDELQYLGKNNGLSSATDTYQIRHALLYVALLIPNHLYELLPISVLIGSIFVMARLAQSSEFTILRTSGLDPWRALKLLLALGAVFVALSFALGDYVAPASERAAQLLKARYQNKITIGQTGAWLKEKQTYNTFVVNVKALTPDNKMQGVQVFEFNNKGLIVSTMQAPLAVFSKGEAWLLQQATRVDFDVPAGLTPAGKAQETAKVNRATLASLRWPTGISSEMVSVAPNF